MNHFKDIEDEFEKVKLIARFINPTAATELFDKKTVDVAISTEDVMFNQMANDLKGRYTPEELQRMMDDPKHYESLTRIEKA